MNQGLVSHWEYGTWAPGETRLHWYLLPESVPREAVNAVASLLDVPGFDIVPVEWLHCTVVALLPSLAAADRAAVDQMVDGVRSAVAGLGPITAEATLEAHHSALVWTLEPGDAFTEVFDAVVPACGSLIRTDVLRAYQPHLTVAYSSARHEEESVAGVLASGVGKLETVGFSSLLLLDVRQQDRCYQWDTVSEILLS